jgi:hypothetical protein
VRAHHRRRQSRFFEDDDLMMKMLLMMMMMMRDVLCNRTFLLFSTDRRKPLSLSLSRVFFICVFSSQTAEEFSRRRPKKKTSSAPRMQKEI